ncbi:hypothetical protein [Prevotella sp. 885]|uniref:hypothetical protein n=1 Tax=Prevotella sp. 885 TaxID=2022527 RepID=UPI001140DBAA|nr:hypothetical protein [Prevotella sp. 885]
MKRTLISMLTLLAVTAASADNYSYLAFQTADGSTRSIGVESLEMTFSDGKLIASNGTESLEISVADLTRMFFSSEATAIKDISLDADSPVKAYTVEGVCVGSYDNMASASANMGKGVYIVKGEKTTHKITIR